MEDQTTQFIQFFFVREEYIKRDNALWSMGGDFKGQISETLTMGTVNSGGKFEVYLFLGHLAQSDDFSTSHYSRYLLGS